MLTNAGAVIGGLITGAVVAFAGFYGYKYWKHQHKTTEPKGFY
jgi:predicted negative regulator of RcsB-dependent stress response